MYSAGTFSGIAFPDRAHRAFRMRAPGPVARRIQENRATRERSVRIEDHLDLRDIRVAVRHARRRRPAIEVALRQPRVERRSHRHRHVRRVVMRQPLRRRGGRLGRRGGRRLALSDQLGDRVRVKIARRLGLLRRRLLRPFGRRVDEFWPHRRLEPALLGWRASAGGRRLRAFRAASAQAPAEASHPLWAAARVSAAGFGFGGGVGCGLRFGRRRRRLWRGRRLGGRAQIRRRLGGAGAGCGAGLASFSPLAI